MCWQSPWGGSGDTPAVKGCLVLMKKKARVGFKGSEAPGEFRVEASVLKEIRR